MTNSTWTGQPITLHREHGDRIHRGVLGYAVNLPDRHVHPAVQKAAEAVQQARADRVALEAELNDRGPARAAIATEAATNRSPGPARVAAAGQLRDFDAETEFIRSSLLPAAHAAELSTWDTLADTVASTQGHWDRYLRQHGKAAVAELRDATERFRHALAECQLIDGLVIGKGVLHDGGTSRISNQERYNHAERDQSVGRLLGGTDLGAEGRQLGAIELADQYEQRITPQEVPSAA